MRYLIYGAGTIGTAYAWLLSHQHEVDVYVRNEDKKGISKKETVCKRSACKRNNVQREKYFCKLYNRNN